MTNDQLLEMFGTTTGKVRVGYFQADPTHVANLEHGDMMDMPDMGAVIEYASPEIAVQHIKALMAGSTPALPFEYNSVTVFKSDPPEATHVCDAVDVPVTEIGRDE